MKRIMIIEDEALAAEHLRRMINELEPAWNVAGSAASVASAVEWLQQNELPDLIFSDIRLLDGVSFEIFQQVKIDTPVIFTTAYDEYAIKAFEVNSLDYLLKPLQKEKLQSAIDKYKQRQASPASTPPIDVQAMINLLKASSAEYKSRFMVKVGQKLLAIPTEKIAYFFSENKLTFILTREGKKYPIDQTLEELNDVLDPKKFFRINRQFIITFESIGEMHPYFKGRIKLDLQPKIEEEVVISAERTPEFKKWIDQ